MRKSGQRGCKGLQGVRCLLAKYKVPADLEDEAYEREERFRMSELTEKGEGDSGVGDEEFPEQFSSGIGVKVKEARNTPKWLLGGLSDAGCAFCVLSVRR